jgi:hypothetical protein
MKVMPLHIKRLYLYFLTNSHESLKEFYAMEGSEDFVKKYGIKGRKFYVNFMKLVRFHDPFHVAHRSYYAPTYFARSFKKGK